MYDCPQCEAGAGWACSTVNDDEDGNMCDECLDKFAREYQEWYDKEVSQSNSPEANQEDAGQTPEEVIPVKPED